MHRNEIQSNTVRADGPPDPALVTRNSGGHVKPKFTPACDSRNRRVSGLCVRNGRYYAQLWVDRGNGTKGPKRFPLVDSANLQIRTLQAAKDALDVKRHERRERKLPTAGRKPLFADYSEVYFQKGTVQRKRPGTLENERQAIARWRNHLGHIRIGRIGTPIIAAYVEKRLKGGVFCNRLFDPVSAGTANLDLLMLRNVLNAAVEDGHLRDLPKILVKRSYVRATATNPGARPRKDNPMQLKTTHTADEINSLGQQITAMARTSLDLALRIGMLLWQQKESLPHGQWLNWIRANVTSSIRRVDRYLMIYGKRDQLKMANVSKLSGLGKVRGRN